MGFLSDEYPNNIIRAKSLSWLASRPNVAINFSQAGGTLRIEHAGVWCCSKPPRKRLQYESFVHLGVNIEKRWSKEWSDRMNETVFIG